MDIFQILEKQVCLFSCDSSEINNFNQYNSSNAPANEGFRWLDVTHDEVSENPELWRQKIQHITGVQIYDLHLKDVVNLNHPSYFDATQDYEMVVFRKLSFHQANTTETNPLQIRKKIPGALHKLNTLPVSFILTDNTLITVRSATSLSIEAFRQRLLAYSAKSDENKYASKLPSSPEELMLRLLNTMVDQYLELRQSLTQQLDRWQHALLDPRKPFNNWLALLDSRIELRKLDNLCEEQHDALQELRDHIIDTYASHSDQLAYEKDLLLVRTNDVIEHIARVLNHARRLESSLESAVQIHFAAMAHKTNETMRTLTVITALFMPLTLLTGVFGMNFVEMPLIGNKFGFWIAIGMMAALVVLLILYFKSKQYMDEGRHNQPGSARTSD